MGVRPQKIVKSSNERLAMRRSRKPPRRRVESDAADGDADTAESLPTRPPIGAIASTGSNWRFRHPMVGHGREVSATKHSGWE